MITHKVAAAVRNGITPILCVGETKHERREGETKQVLHDQLMTALHDLTAEEVSNMVIAYEPVWAIGSEGLAKPDQISSAVEYIRGYVKDIFSAKAARELRVIYGAGVIPDMVQGYLSVPGLDGFLVGHESLNYQQFADIVESAHRWQRDKGEQ